MATEKPDKPLSERLDEQAHKRARDMAKLQDREPVGIPKDTIVLHIFKGDSFHFYACPDEISAHKYASKLREEARGRVNEPEPDYVIGKLEELPSAEQGEEK